MPLIPDPTLRQVRAAASAGRVPDALASVPSVLALRVLSADSAELTIYGEIGDSWWSESVTAKQVAEQLAQLQASTINVRINSAGGSVTDGLAIYQQLKRHKARKVVTIDGQAASIASLIAMAGDDVIMPATSLLMLHAPWSIAQGNAAAFREYADVLDTHADAMAQAYATKTGKPAEDMAALLKDGKDHWYTSAQAIEAGLADRESGAIEQPADPAATASALRSLFGSLGKAPATVAAGLRQCIAACALPSFARLNREIQQAVLAAAPEGQMKQEMHSIFANAGGAPNPTPAPNPAPAAAQVVTVQAAQPSPTTPAVNPTARTLAIQSIFRPHRGNEALAELERHVLGDASITAEAAAAQLMARLAADNAPLNQPNAALAAGTIVPGNDERDHFITRGALGLMARSANIPDARADAEARQGNPFANSSLLAVAELCMIRAGVSASSLRNMSREELARQAMLLRPQGSQSTSDFPIILETAMYKTLQRGFTLKALTWRNFCAVGSVNDFRDHNRYNLGGFGDLETVNQAGEFKDGTLTDGTKETVSAQSRGRILRLTREVMINDDLNAFMNLALALGVSANRSIEKAVYVTLAKNSNRGPTLKDTKALFHADHGNLISSGAGAPSVAQVSKVRQLMAKQKNNGDDYIDVTPAVALVPVELKDSMLVVLNSQYDPTSGATQTAVNTARNFVSTVVESPRLTNGTQWYVFADPSIDPVLEVSFLDGNQNPQIVQEEDFGTAGLKWRVMLDFGVNGVGYRGAVMNVGA